MSVSRNAGDKLLSRINDACIKLQPTALLRPIIVDKTSPPVGAKALYVYPAAFKNF